MCHFGSKTSYPHRLSKARLGVKLTLTTMGSRAAAMAKMIMRTVIIAEKGLA